MKYYKNFTVIVNHPYAFDKKEFTLTTKEMMPIQAIRFILKGAMKPSYSLIVKHKLDKKVSTHVDSIIKAVNIVSKTVLHRNAVRYDETKEFIPVDKFIFGVFSCMHSTFMGDEYTFFKPQEFTNIRALQELIPYRKVKVSATGNYYVKGYFSFEDINDDWYFGETVTKYTESTYIAEI